MANTKITQLTVATTLDSNTQNTLFIVVDKSSGTPVTKQVELQKIDTVLDYTVDKANSAALYANGAFIQANAAFISLNTGALSAASYANAAFLKANSAYDSQNATGIYANAAFLVANTPSYVSNSAALYANAAFIKANSSYDSQNVSGSYANSGLSKANSVYALANLNYLQAATRLNVSYTSTTAYLFDQYVGNNPTLHLLPGQTIAFDLNYVDANPFLIRISAGGVNVSTRLVHISSDGVVSFNDEAQGKTSGVLYWKVPNDLSNQQYVYQNANQPSTMVGTIRLEPTISAIQNIANAGYAKTNTSSEVANSASLYANGAFIQANSAYAAANGYATYTSPIESIWNSSSPITISEAIHRLANAVYVLRSNTTIP